MDEEALLERARSVARQDIQKALSMLNHVADRPGVAAFVAHLRLVHRITSTSDYYEVLDVQRTATDAEIKKQYRKLALQLHPDKNKEPRAEEAFKVISQAFACLSDESKRAHYDRYGSERNNPSPASHGGGAASFDDLTPEEIFQAFFGMPTGMEPRVFVRRRNPAGQNFYSYTFTNNRNHHNNHANHHANQDHPGFSFVQLLPILMLVLMAFLGGSGHQPSLYELSKTREYSVPRKTSNLGVTYYVKQDFNPESVSIPKLDAAVESSWIRHMQNECYQERAQKRRLNEAANRMWAGERKEEALKQAKEYPTPSCDVLQRMAAA